MESKPNGTMEWALRAEAAEAEVERMHGIFRMFSAEDAITLEDIANALDVAEMDLENPSHALQDALRAIAEQSRASWAR